MALISNCYIEVIQKKDNAAEGRQALGIYPRGGNMKCNPGKGHDGNRTV